MYFDTSPNYGDSEEIIGKFLKKVEKKDIYFYKIRKAYRSYLKSKV
jgi:aryl-alcohol dehydrogenase-like predicted oxidoreductase